jgi:4-amino-4-deoxy-L-arabinose transferase-like glycosyltransferase
MFSRHSYIIIIIILALFLRFYGAAMPFFIDDDTDWILLANFISFNSKSLSLLPFGSGHGPLTAYLVKFSGILFGENAFGWRVLSIIFGTLLVMIIYLITKEGLDSRVANFAAYLSAINIPFIFMSKYATDDIYSLFFFCLSLLFLIRALIRQNNIYMLLAGISLGLGLLTKENIILLVVVFSLFLVFTKKFRFWLKRRAYYISICIGVAISWPYLYWLFTHKFYFFQSAIKEGGQWINFFNLPLSITYLFLGLPQPLFDKEFALGYHFIGPWIGVFCIMSILYSLRYLKNNFILLMQMIFWVVFFCETIFFRGIPRQFIIIIVPALITTAFMFEKFWQRNKFYKFLIVIILGYFLISTLFFTLNSEKYYSLHSQKELSLLDNKLIQIDLNYLAQLFILYGQPFNPTLLVFPEPGLDPVDNFVNAYSRKKTIGSSLENRFLPYVKEDFKRVVFFSIFNDDLKRYEAWAKKNIFNSLREEKEVCLTSNYCLPFKLLILSTNNIDNLTDQQIDDFVTLSMPYHYVQN